MWTCAPVRGTVGQALPDEAVYAARTHMASSSLPVHSAVDSEWASRRSAGAQDARPEVGRPPLQVDQ